MTASCVSDNQANLMRLPYVKVGDRNPFGIADAAHLQPMCSYGKTRLWLSAQVVGRLPLRVGWALDFKNLPGVVGCVSTHCASELRH